MGVAEAAIEEFAGFVARRAARRPAPPALEALHARLGEAAAEVRAARLLIGDAAGANMAKLNADGHLTADDGIACMQQASYACVLAGRAVTRLFEACGAHGIYLSNVMQRTFRDIHASTVHAALNWDRNALHYGQMVVARRSHGA